jgi:hypothetical protein
MLAMMVMAQAAGPWDYTGMHCVLLRHKVPPPRPVRLVCHIDRTHLGEQ